MKTEQKIIVELNHTETVELTLPYNWEYSELNKILIDKGYFFYTITNVFII